MEEQKGLVEAHTSESVHPMLWILACLSVVHRAQLQDHPCQEEHRPRQTYRAGAYISTRSQMTNEHTQFVKPGAR